MQCYTELIPPSAVTHAVSLPFLNANANNLVVAKTCLLQVFRVKDSRTSSGDVDGNTKSARQSTLVLVGEYPLAGTVTALSSISALNTKSGGDALLIAFKDAKLSLVEWDPENYRISTTSIHYYEGENVAAQPFGPSLSESHSILTVDPSSRCAALKFGARNMAILPFRQFGDDLVEGGEDGYDPELDIAPPSATLKRTQSGFNEAPATDEKQTPYKASFVLPLTALDPSLTHPVHLTFLHEYREPTFGILSAPIQASYALLEERKDILSYTVFTLDLDQRASTNLITVERLPSDLWKVMSLPLPVGGALLVGTNELVHIDQSGKTNAVAVNEFAKTASAFSMADQSALNMKLEDCEIEFLDPVTGDLLIILNDGSLGVLSFRMSGRNVSGLNIVRVTPENGVSLVESAPSCTASLHDNSLFLGSEDGESTLLGWTKFAATISRKRSHAQMLGTDNAIDEEENSEDLDDDDLYATTAEVSKHTDSFSSPSQLDAASTYQFEVLDILPSLGPIHNVCLGRSPSMPKDKLELVGATGRGPSSRLAFMSREIVPDALSSTTLINAQNAWSLNTDPERDSDNLLFVYDGEGTKVFDINSSGGNPSYFERTDTEFEHEGETLTVSTLAKCSRVVQCRSSEIRTYDAGADLALSQIIPIMDEETDVELKIVHTSFCDPYLFVLRDDSSVLVLQADANGEIEPIELQPSRQRNWVSGCLYSGAWTKGETFAFLLGEEGGLHVFELPGFEQIYTAPTLSYLPAVLSPDAPQRRVGARDTLTELLFADLGDEQPYLILRNALDDVAIYEPWMNGNESWNTSLRFRKVPFNFVPKFNDSVHDEDDDRPKPLKSLRAGGRNVVYVPAPQPTFILKDATSQPKALGIQANNFRSLLPLQNGFGLIENGDTLRECQLPTNTDFGTGWSVQKIALGDPTEDVRHVAYHESRQLYIVATCRDVDFYFTEEDGRHQEQDDISLRPQVPRCTLYLLSAQTRKVIHSIEMPYLETITSLKVMPLEISEQSHEQKPMVVVGTTALRGEDMPAKGAINVFELLEVVPEPDRPESEYKLHLVSREETKGAITAVESFPGGLIGTAQGQKIMVRGLKEDGSCLPVAFLDAQCHTVQLKSLARSGMFLAGDAWKGLWFGGFTEEPYKLTVLGKSRTHMELVVSEFLPFEGQLYLMIIDAQMDLHVLQFDPENPKSLSGTRLLHRSTIHLGQFPSSMTLLPSTLAPMSKQPIANGETNGDDTEHTSSLFHILITSMTGSISLITPTDEATYRRLGSIQTQLTSVLEHAAGLNPRAYRSVESESLGSRGIIDGSLVQRINELGSARRSEVLGRAGTDGWTVRSDLEIIGGGGLAYL